ncbi:MAG TPA: PLP-dependent aminotransferase family protein, partial [Anaerolineales bacterium]|nr:PLP-dependent aminotransferase family protein [Anaerolineales bacterium]
MNLGKANTFNPQPGAPLYQQLYAHMRAAILSGELKRGLKLPSSRALADELGVSRNTVQNAYRQLAAEGYLESVEGSGTFVTRVLPDLLLAAPGDKVPKDSSRAPVGSPGETQFSDHARLQLQATPMPEALPQPSPTRPRPFRADVPALDVFPYELWRRLAVRQARRLPRSAFLYQDSAGYLPLREAIAAHIAVSRQVHCLPDQVMIVPGSQGALDLASRMLINSGDSVWMEDPGYPGARGAFIGAGARVVPVPVDDEGLVVDIGVARSNEARLVYVTPSHQFPLGVTLSLSRRLALLDWAKRVNAYVIEDDYDSEFRFTGRPLAALQGLDDANRVIYVGTFSKVLFPSIRIGYMILPTPLIGPFLNVRRLVDIHSPMLEQAVLADFMIEGHFRRHLRRMRTLYAERRRVLLEAVTKLPLEIHSPEA